jgi:hypothetical protein
MIFLEFCCRFSDALHGTGNKSMQIRIFEKIYNFDKISLFSQNLMILTKFEDFDKI